MFTVECKLKNFLPLTHLMLSYGQFRSANSELLWLTNNPCVRHQQLKNWIWGSKFCISAEEWAKTTCKNNRQFGHEWTWMCKIHAASLHDKPKHRAQPQKGFCFKLEKCLPVHSAFFCNPGNKLHSDRNTVSADILWRLEQQSTTFCMCLPPSSGFLF